MDEKLREHDLFHCFIRFASGDGDSPFQRFPFQCPNLLLLTDHENGDSYTPPPEVEAFVGDGRDISQAPIYFGFGSMIHKDPPKVLDMCLQVVANTGRKAVICEGWYLLRRPSADGRVEGENPHKSLLELLSPYGIPQNRVMFVKSIPHTWLLPRCACAVVHGGAGTTAAALRAGRPCVFVPFLVDQPVWKLG